MAIDLTLKSTAVTNREATPAVINNPGLGHGAVMKSATGYLASVSASLSITSIIRMVEVPSNAYIRGIYFQSAAQGAGAFDIGVYRNNADGGAVADQNLFASAVNCASAVVRTDVTNESTNNTTALQEQPLWEAAGLSVDPHSTLDICLIVTGTDVTTGTGAVKLEAQYVK